MKRLWQLRNLVNRGEHRPANRSPVSSRRVAFEALEDRRVMAVAFVFDYRFDTNGFFSDPSRKAALEYAGKMLGERLADTLDPIVPSGGNTWSAEFTHPGTGAFQSVANPRIAANTLLVFAGGRSLAGTTLAIGGSGGWSANGANAWLDTVEARGELGALTAVKTDVGPWGGVITFDTVGTAWHFGTTTVGLDNGELDFVSVAMHELGHVLGINSDNPSWERLVSGGQFNGVATKAENGGVAPATVDSHFADGVTSDRLEVLMDPSITDASRKFLSQLDAAALDDIGWTLNTDVDDTIYSAQHQLTQLAQVGRNSVTIRAGISTALDADVYRIYAEAGTDLNAIVQKRGTAATTLNTLLRLSDAAGKTLKSGNLGGINASDTLTFRFTRSDYYFVSVLRASGGGTSGLYQLKLATSFGVAVGAAQSAAAFWGGETTSAAPPANASAKSVPTVLVPAPIRAVDALFATFLAEEEEVC